MRVTARVCAGVKAVEEAEGRDFGFDSGGASRDAAHSSERKTFSCQRQKQNKYSPGLLVRAIICAG